MPNLNLDKPVCIPRYKLSPLPVKILCKNMEGEFPILGEYVLDNGYKVYGLWRKDGSSRHWLSLSTVREEWINVYPARGLRLHPTREDADAMCDSGRIARIKVTFIEGQYDE